MQENTNFQFVCIGRRYIRKRIKTKEKAFDQRVRFIKFHELIVNALGWYVFDLYRSKAPEAPAPVEEQMAPVAPPAEVLPSGSLPAPLTQMQEVAATPAEQPAVSMTASNASEEALNATVPEQAPVAAPAAVVAAEPAVRPETVTAPAPSVGERTMRIVAHSASWLQARPDDKVLDYFLRKGETTTITFSESLSIKFGNAGGVKLELDGQPYPFEGTLGEVKTLVVE